MQWAEPPNAHAEGEGWRAAEGRVRRTASSLRIRRGDARGGGEGHENRRLLPPILRSSAAAATSPPSSASRCSPSARTPDGLEEVRPSRSRSRRPTLSRRGGGALRRGRPRVAVGPRSHVGSMRRKSDAVPTPPAALVAAPPSPRRRRRPAAVETSGVRGDGYARLVDEEEGGGGGRRAHLPEPPTPPPAHLAAGGRAAAARRRRPTADWRFPPPPKPSLGPAPTGQGRAGCGARGGLRAGAACPARCLLSSKQAPQAAPAPPRVSRARATRVSVRRVY